MSAKTIDDGLAAMYAVYQAAAELSQRKYAMRPLTADEGGLAPPFPSVEAAFDDAIEAIQAAGFQPGHDVALAVDVASSHLYRGGRYHLEGESLDAAGMIDRFSSACRPPRGFGTSRWHRPSQTASGDPDST